MNVPIRFQYLPLDGDSPDLDKLTSLHNDAQGSDREHYCLLSYFPEELRLSEENNFVINKYLLFVKDPEPDTDYQITWSYQVIKDNIDITDTLVREVVKNDFDFTLSLQYLEAVNEGDWELELKIKCEIVKNDLLTEDPITLEQKITPIESSLLSSSGASFEDESGSNKTSIRLGNEETTHFLRGHLSEYLIERKSTIADLDGDGSSNDDNPNNASVFVNQTASIIYLNTLRGLKYFVPDSSLIGEQEISSSGIDYIFDTGWLISALEGRLPMSGYARVGICSINLHHAIAFFKEENKVRIETNADVFNYVKEYFTDEKEDLTRLYNLCAFPKSAIELSVEIFKALFEAFQATSTHANKIYKTFKTSATEQNNTITAWKKLKYSELREVSNDHFMKNLIAEYYAGFFKEVTKKSIRYGKARRILKIDWSQFIQKLLNPGSVGAAFTLIKIQVRDLRSGKPAKNKLIKKLEFHASSSPLDPSPTVFKYEVKKAFEETDVLSSDDSKNKKLQKILKCMGYFSYAAIAGPDVANDNYNNSLRTAIFSYLTDGDRDLSSLHIDVPPLAADVDNNKDAWIDYIIDDFYAHCITSDDGILNCKVPDALLKDNQLNIHIGFSEFAIVLEKLMEEDNDVLVDTRIDRPLNTGAKKYEPTKFVASWEGAIGDPNEQNLDWNDTLNNNKNFGWKISEEGNGMTDYLQVALSLPVKLDTDVPYDHILVESEVEGKKDSSRKDSSHFSKYFEASEVHFVVYGMQWCQAVWNPIPATTTHMIRGKVSPVNGFPHSLNEPMLPANRNFPKVVSTPTGGGTGQGRDYGAFVPRQNRAVDENGVPAPAFNAADPAAIVVESYSNNGRNTPRVIGGNRPHYGLDYSGIDGVTPAFLPHGAKVDSVRGTRTVLSNSNGYGIQRVFKCREYYFRLAHLSGDRTRNAGNPDENLRDLPIGDGFLCGTWIGFAGRTYEEDSANVGNRYYSGGATHLHLEIGRGNMRTHLVNPKTIFNNFENEKENEVVIMNNDSLKLFPCDCHWPTASGSNAAKCAVRDNLGIPVANRLTTTSSNCWASSNLHCPYLDPAIGGTPARRDELRIFKMQAQLTYLREDDPGTYGNPNGIDGGWGNGAENAIEQFRQEHINTLIPVVANRPPAADPWWRSQPADGDDTSNELDTQAPYPRVLLNREDQ